MMASDHTMGKWPSNHWFSQIIFRPMNTSTPARPVLQQRELHHRGRQHEIQRPQAEDREDVGRVDDQRLCVSAKIAGTESIANTMSLTSIATSARNSGVACHW